MRLEEALIHKRISSKLDVTCQRRFHDASNKAYCMPIELSTRIEVRRSSEETLRATGGFSPEFFCRERGATVDDIPPIVRVYQ